MLRLKTYLNEDNITLNYKDYLTMFAIVLIYGLISFYNLGSMTNPNTIQTFSKADSLII